MYVGFKGLSLRNYQDNFVVPGGTLHFERARARRP